MNPLNKILYKVGLWAFNKIDHYKLRLYGDVRVRSGGKTIRQYPGYLGLLPSVIAGMIVIVVGTVTLGKVIPALPASGKETLEAVGGSLLGLFPIVLIAVIGAITLGILSIFTGGAREF